MLTTSVRKSLVWLAVGGAVAGVAMLANAPRTNNSQHAFAAAPLPQGDGPLVGDALLNGQWSLSRAVLEGDHYRVALRDGSRAILTLSPRLQQAAEEALERAQAPVGAIVVMDPNGRVLALAGRTGGKNGQRADQLPVTVWAPAASVFKIVTAAALLQHGVSPAQRVCYHGGLRGISEEHLSDSPRDRECGDLTAAMAFSINSIFAKLSHQKLQRTDLEGMARAFGIGSLPPFALDTERGRVALPSDPLGLARSAAGFWNVEMSPLEGASLTAVVANRGRKVTPRIIDAIVDGDGHKREVLSEPSQVVLDETIAAALADMMSVTVTRGTAREGFHDKRGRPYFPHIAIAGKTGSLTQGEPYRAFSWFVGFAPIESPRVIVSVLLGNGEKWHIKAHTAARMVLQSAL